MALNTTLHTCAHCTNVRTTKNINSPSGINPGGVLVSGFHQLFPLPGSAYWLTLAQFSQNIKLVYHKACING